MNNEDIKILEKLRYIYKELKKDFEEGHASAYEMQFEDLKAIENLLTRYKEIKIEHRIMKRILVEHNLWETLLNDDEFIKHLEEE